MSRHQQKIIERYYEHKDTINANRLAEIVSDLYLTEGGSAATKLWDRAAKALAACELDSQRISAVVRGRDLDALARIAGELAVSGGPKKKTPGQAPPAAPPARPAPSAATPAASPPPAATPPAAAIDPTAPEVLKAALKAFKRRMKLNRLDEESKLGRSPLTGGQKSRIVAIQPPRDYPPAVWEELVKQKKLKPAGPGFYELVQD